MNTNESNRPVDVLHDMRDGAAKLGAAKQEPAALRLLDAHDAVAELIDAACPFAAIGGGFDMDDVLRLRSVLNAIGSQP